MSLFHQRGDVHVVWSAIQDLHRGRRKDANSLKIRFWAQAKYVESHGYFCVREGTPGSLVEAAVSATGKKHSKSSGSLPVFLVTCSSPAGIRSTSPGLSAYSPLSANVVPRPDNV